MSNGNANGTAMRERQRKQISLEDERRETVSSGESNAARPRVHLFLLIPS